MRDTSSQNKIIALFTSNTSLPFPTQATNATDSTWKHHLTKRDASNEKYDDHISNRRAKRQNADRQQLCQTTYQYITPQAALNSQGEHYILLLVNYLCDSISILSMTLFCCFFFVGNWMYIVNQVEQSRQLVRTETCA